MKRSVRAAVVMPAVFGLTHVLFANPQISLFAAFGSFALLLLVDFSGRPRSRLVAFVSLFVVGGGFVVVGTVVSTHKLAAVAAMAVVAFVVLFAGVVSPQAATATTAAILIFVLPVAVAAPPSAVGPRLLGWAFAGAFCIPACLLVWPTPWHDELRRRLASTVSALAALAGEHAAGRADPDAEAVVSAELASLKGQFAATPYPPTSTATSAVALAKLVGRIEWVAGNVVMVDPDVRALDQPALRNVLGAVAATLCRSSAVICDDTAHPVDDPRLTSALQEATRQLDAVLAGELESEVSALLEPAGDPGPPPGPTPAAPSPPGAAGIAAALDPTFHARALGIATELVADASLEAAGAEPVGDRRFGVTDDVAGLEFWRRLTSRLSLRSVWFRNALRGAVGLALAVAVVEVTNVEHGFWVVLGTLSVLRSNALGTGATALRAVGGTAVGFVIGSAIMFGVAGHLALLWLLLPLAVLVSGVAPSLISFAAGQAGFTVVVIILFNIIEPSGWQVGLTRVEDVAIGCAVSVVVGLLFWPRGATAALGRALSEAFVASWGYLADAVDRLTFAEREVSTETAARAAHATYLRLDDAFRQFVAERGAKVVSIETIANLFTGTNRIRLAAYTLASQPVIAPDAGRGELESVEVAGAVLRDAYAASRRWYEEFAEVLDDRRAALDPPPQHDAVLNDVLQQAFDDARARNRGDRLRTTLQMLWADELLETQRKVQADLAEAADRFARHRRRHSWI